MISACVKVSPGLPRLEVSVTSMDDELVETLLVDVHRGEEFNVDLTLTNASSMAVESLEAACQVG